MFDPNASRGYNVEHFRDFNNAGPTVAVGFETMPGHQASNTRGEYQVNFGGPGIDSVGVTTYGGVGIYGAKIGGLWDALLGEGRNWFFYASSDWHNRGVFSPYVRESSDTPSTNAFCRVAPSLLFSARAIFATGVFCFANFFSSRIFSFVHFTPFW